MLIPKIEGLKFPVEYITRFFFKEALHQLQGRVLELGCGNGNNLMLFYQYGWEVTGIDCSINLIEQANHNFLMIEKEYGLANFRNLHVDDMLKFVECYSGAPFDVLLLPHSIYYLHYAEILRLLQLLRDRQILTPAALLFLTVRTLDDYRFGRGEAIGPNSYRLDIEETGEKGCVNTFFAEWEIVELLKNNFQFEYLHVSKQTYGNYQSNHLVTNSDITLWGKLKGAFH